MTFITVLVCERAYGPFLSITEEWGWIHRVLEKQEDEDSDGSCEAGISLGLLLGL